MISNISGFYVFLKNDMPVIIVSCFVASMHTENTGNSRELLTDFTRAWTKTYVLIVQSLASKRDADTGIIDAETFHVNDLGNLWFKIFYVIFLHRSLLHVDQWARPHLRYQSHNLNKIKSSWSKDAT